MIVDKLTDAIIQKQNPTCVGLDTAPEYLPAELLKGAEGEEALARAVYAFNREIIDATHDIVPAVKVQIAYYEELGVPGIQCFYDTVRYAKSKGLFIIADCKRNDIGSTAARYSAAYLKKGVADFLTVNGYLGTDGISPFLADCREKDAGLFVLVKTSNPSSGELQNLKLADGRTVYECMGDMVEEWGKDSIGSYGYSCVGAVVGATHPEEAAILRARLPHTFFLIPGYGAQGGNAEMLKSCFKKGGLGGIVNNSRGILCAYKKRGGSAGGAAREACIDMKEDLLSVLGEICAK